MPKSRDKGESKVKKKAQKNLKEKRAAKKMKGTGSKTYSTMTPD